jgi:hypothetical protein
MAKIKSLKDGERFDVALPSVGSFTCCDCGLTHRITLTLKENGKLGVAMERSPRSTAQVRRHLKPKP